MDGGMVKTKDFSDINCEAYIETINTLKTQTTKTAIQIHAINNAF